jgi:threonine dehydrogenase-like Zn-dependent dehydrogenase
LSPHDRAAAIVDALSDGAVEVVGRGPIAEAVRELLGVRLTDEAGARSIVETTGSPDAIAAALERVASGGRVIVAAPVPEAPALDTYGELHVRGLELVVLPSSGGE